MLLCPYCLMMMSLKGNIGDSMIQEGKVTITTEDGKETVFHVLVTFELKEKKKTYVIYTDYKKTEDGNIKLYSSIYNQNGTLEIIKDKEEIDFVQSYIETLEKDLKSGIQIF